MEGGETAEDRGILPSLPWPRGAMWPPIRASSNVSALPLLPPAQRPGVWIPYPQRKSQCEPVTVTAEAWPGALRVKVPGSRSRGRWGPRHWAPGRTGPGRLRVAVNPCWRGRLQVLSGFSEGGDGGSPQVCHGALWPWPRLWGVSGALRSARSPLLRHWVCGTGAAVHRRSRALVAGGLSMQLRGGAERRTPDASGTLRTREQSRG